MNPSPYTQARETLAAANANPACLPCLRCKTATAHATLAQYGARCFACFLDFCAEPDKPAAAPTRFAREAKEYTRRLMAHRIASNAPLPPGVKP